MPAAHSEDFRERVVAAVAAGASRRAAAARFQVGVSSAIRWTTLEKATGSVSAKHGRRKRSALEAHSAWLLALNETEPFLTLAQIVARFADELGVATSQSAVRRCFQRHRISVKKTEHASERDRPDVAEARERWIAGQAGLDPAKLVFVDETGANTKMAASMDARRSASG